MMKIYSFLRISIFIFFFISFAAVLVLAQEEKKDVEDITYYLEEGKAQEFILLTPEEKSAVFQSESVTKEQKDKLLKSITSEIFKKKLAETSGRIAGLTGETDNQFSRENVRYPDPEKLTFVGFDDKDLKFAGDDKNPVITNDKVSLNLNSLPKVITKIEYKDGEFILTSDKGSLTLTAGSTNGLGELIFIAKHKGKIGDLEMSSKLEAFRMIGEVSATDQGFEFKGKGSLIKHEDGIQVGLDLKTEKGSVDFTNRGVDLKGAYAYLKGKFFVNPTVKDKVFAVVIGNDWSLFLKKKYTGGDIKFKDVSETISYETKYSANRGGAFSYTARTVTLNEFGELTINGNSDIPLFEKKGKSLDVSKLSSIKELESNSVYEGSSGTMRAIMKHMYENPTDRTMIYVEREIFNDKKIVEENEELYKQFYARQDFTSTPAGMAISLNTADGKPDVFINPGKVGGTARFYSDLGMVTVTNIDDSKPFGISLDGNGRSDLIFEGRDVIKSKSFYNIKAEKGISIEEIRRMDHRGDFDPSKTLTVFNDKGEYALDLNNEVTVFNAMYNPVIGQLTVNNELLLSTVALSETKFTKSVEAALKEVKRSEGDIKHIGVLISDVNKLYGKVEEDDRKRIVDTIRAIGRGDENALQIPIELPQDVKTVMKDMPYLPSPADLDLVSRAIGLKALSLREAVETDLKNLRDNPLVAEIRMTADRDTSATWKGFEQPSTYYQGYDLDDPASFPNQLSSRDYTINVDVTTPELETLKFFSGSTATAATAELKSIQKTMLDNALTQTIVKGVVGNSFTIPKSTIYSDADQFWVENIVTPKTEYRLKQIYVDDISQAVSTALGQVSFVGPTRLTITNIPKSKTVEVSLVSGSKTIPLKLNAGTNDLIWASVRAGLTAPGPLKGYFDGPLKWNYVNVPRGPNKVVEDYFRAVGFQSYFLGLETKKTIQNEFLNRYFLK